MTLRTMNLRAAIQTTPVKTKCRLERSAARHPQNAKRVKQESSA
jgi:hypothetical protein